MATYSKRRSTHQRTAANVQDTITLSHECPAVRITNRDGTTDLYVAIGAGAAIAVDADDASIVLPRATRLFNMPTPNAAVVRVVSAQPVDYSVECEN